MRQSLLAYLVLAAVTLASSQTEKISLWNGPAPGTENRENAEKIEANGSIVRVFQPDLTFYPAPNQSSPAPALVVCPGGGYNNIVMPKEGVRIAEFFQKRGFAVFVLKYRLEPGEAVQDARRAMRVIRQNASQYHINASQLGIMGFSAGGHLCANLTLNFAKSDISDETDKISARPDFCAPIYAVLEPFTPTNFPISRYPALAKITNLSEQVTKGTPPTFLAHAVDDGTVPVDHSLHFFQALKARGVPVELHIYEKGGHGFALETSRSYAASWGESFILWLKSRGVEPVHTSN